MKTKYTFILACLILTSPLFAQEEIQTVFTGDVKSHGGYAALTNKFTMIDGQYANMVGLYGGWFINHKVMLGVGAVAATNFIPVPDEANIYPGKRTSFGYTHFGLVTEYVIASNKAIHASAHLLTGAGLTFQYIRDPWDEYDYSGIDPDTNWFLVLEPGVQLEINMFKWMRFCPGVSYRYVNNSKSEYLTDGALRGASLDLTLKFGRF